MNNLTTLAKRLRPLIVSVAKSVFDSSGSGLFGHAMGGYDNTAGAHIPYQIWGINMPDNADSFAYGAWEIPSNYKGGTINFSFAFRSTVSGNLYCFLELASLRCGEISTNMDQYYSSWVTGTITHPSPGTDGMFCLFGSAELAGLQAGDIVSFSIHRDSTHVSDTINAAVKCIGMTASF